MISAPRTARSASTLAGMVFSESVMAASASSVQRLFGLDHHRHHGLDSGGETDWHLELPQMTNRLAELDVALVDLLSDLATELVGNVRGGDRSEQTMLFSDLRLEHELCPLDRRGELLDLSLYFRLFTLGYLSGLGSLFQRGLGGWPGQSTRNQIVTCVTVGNVFYLARSTESGHCLRQQNLQRWLLRSPDPAGGDKYSA